MMFKDNNELRQSVSRGVLDCKGQDLIVDFDIDIYARIINCRDINCRDINCGDLNCWTINCRDISYYAVCFSYNSFVCRSVKGCRKNNKYFCLDSEIRILGDIK